MEAMKEESKQLDKINSKFPAKTVIYSILIEVIKGMIKIRLFVNRK